MSLRPRPPRGSTWNIESTIGRKRDRLLLCRRGVTVVTPPCDFPEQSQPTALYPESLSRQEGSVKGQLSQREASPRKHGAAFSRQPSKGLSPRKHLKVRTGSFICHGSGNTDWEVLYRMKALAPRRPAFQAGTRGRRWTEHRTRPSPRLVPRSQSLDLSFP